MKMHRTCSLKASDAMVAKERQAQWNLDDDNTGRHEGAVVDWGMPGKVHDSGDL